MSKMICVTNGKLCRGDFFEQMEKVAKSKVDMIVLREKDLSEEEYEALALRVIAICHKYDVACVFHNFVLVAKALGHEAIHLPMPVLRTLSDDERKSFTILGASCHSVEEAKEAEKLGCTYIFAGHVFETDCKKGLEGRGLGFIQNVTSQVNIPVYGLGGINPDNAKSVIDAGASGVAVMSGLMTAKNVEEECQRYILAME